MHAVSRYSVYVAHDSSTRLTRAEQQARTVVDLLDAAEAEFGERGYHAATVESIAERAGYTRGAVYGNFPAGKADLFLAVAERRAGRYVELVTDALAQLDDTAFAATYVELRRRARAQRGFARASVEFGVVAADDPDLRRRYGALRRATIGQVEAGFAPHLAPGADPGAHELATVAVALETGLDLLRWLDDDLVADDLEHRVIDRLGDWADHPG
jgi:AcrR family transcriptional regulator